MSMDLLPTLAILAGAMLPAAHKLEGIDILPSLHSVRVDKPRELHWQHGDDWAIRSGPWKLRGECNQPRMLVNLENDLQESENLLKVEFRLNFKTELSSLTILLCPF
jgi:arylsulfatase A